MMGVGALGVATSIFQPASPRGASPIAMSPAIATTARGKPFARSVSSARIAAKPLPIPPKSMRTSLRVRSRVVPSTRSASAPQCALAAARSAAFGSDLLSRLARHSATHGITVGSNRPSLARVTSNARASAVLKGSLTTALNAPDSFHCESSDAGFQSDNISSSASSVSSASRAASFDFTGSCVSMVIVTLQPIVMPA